MVKVKKTVAKREKSPEFRDAVSVSRLSPLVLPPDETNVSGSENGERTTYVSSTPIVKAPRSRLIETKNATNIVRGRSKPDTLTMIRQAIDAIGEKKGASIQAIKKWIYAQYEVDQQRFMHHFKAAIEKGIANDVIVRPNSSQVSGAVGRLMIKTSDKQTSKLKSDPIKKPKVEKVKLTGASKSIERVRRRSFNQTKKARVIVKKLAVTPRKSVPVNQTKALKKTARGPKEAKDNTVPVAKAKPAVSPKFVSKSKKPATALKRKSIGLVSKTTKVVKPKKP